MNIIKEGWSYTHKFGIIWDDILVITEDKYYDGHHWGYNFYIVKRESSFAEAGQLNRKYDLPANFGSFNSQQILITIQDEFPEAEIAKK